jgi:anti-sigma B factor antagonist
MQLEIETRAVRGRHVVTPRGEIDLVTQGRLKEVISELVIAGNVDIVLDLEETTFLDSTGLGALIGARRKTHAFRGSFSLVCTQERLLKLFRITSLDKVFAIHDDLESALSTREEPEDVLEQPV